METIIGMADAGNDQGLVAINQSLNVRLFMFVLFFDGQKYKKIRGDEISSPLYYNLGLLNYPLKQLEAFRFTSQICTLDPNSQTL